MRPHNETMGIKCYYAIKPSIHNHAPRIVETTLDAIATTTSYTTASAFAFLNVADIFAHPARRFAGMATSLALANLASKFTDSKEWQGAAYFIGQEIGMLSVDAYQYMQTQQANTSIEAFDVELSRALTIWTSNWAKPVVSSSSMRCIILPNFIKHSYRTPHGLKETLLSGIHQAYSGAKSLLPEFQAMNQLMAATASAQNLLQPSHNVLFTPTELFTQVQHYAHKITTLRHRALEEVEATLVEHALPDSEYRNYAMSIMLSKQLMILDSEKQALDVEQQQAEQAVKALEAELNIIGHESSEAKTILEAKVIAAKAVLEKANNAVSEITHKTTHSKANYEQYWQQTPKGSKEAVFTAAEKVNFEARIKCEDLKIEVEYLQQHGIQDSRLADKQKELATAQSTLTETQTTLDSAKLAWKEVLNLEELKYIENNAEKLNALNTQAIADFINQKKTSLKQLDDYNRENEALNEQFLNLMNANDQFSVLQANLNDIDLRIKAIESPSAFIANNVVASALSRHPRNRDAAIQYILDSLVATGAISPQDAVLRVKNSLDNAWLSHSNKKAI